MIFICLSIANFENEKEFEKKMKIHNLKIEKELINLKICGVKNWEIRLDDRYYEVGDILFLREWNSTTLKYETVCLYERITHILPSKPCYGLKPGYVILITQPLYIGNYHHIENFASLGTEGSALVSYLARSLHVEDYRVWERLHVYDWETIKGFSQAKIKEVKTVNFLYKRR